MPHPSEHRAALRPLASGEAEELAETMSAFASPTRLKLLMAMADGERSVEDLAGQARLSMSATSHQLRILRSLRLVRVRRVGRHALYALHDHHVTDLLAAVRHHREHVAPAPALELPADTAARRR
jgi:DNA-binding transcriptional ArsR family regulator